MTYIIHSGIEPLPHVLSGIDKDAKVELIVLNKYCYIWQRALRARNKAKSWPIWLVIGYTLRKKLRQLRPGDNVIICDYFHVCICNAICQLVKPGVGVHLWIWNHLAEDTGFLEAYKQLSKLPVHFHTFDSADAKKFGMTIHPQVYSIKKYCQSENLPIDTDVCFLGYDKGRTPILMDIAAHLEKYRLYLHIANKAEEVVPYAEYIDRLRKSNCVMDVLIGKQTGITLRPLEALTYRKKLITNCSQLRREAFYSPQNIFIMGEDDWEDIDEFLTSPFDTSVLEYTAPYDVNTWLERIVATTDKAEM